MEVQAVKAYPGGTGALRQHLGRLIGTVGTHGFEQALFDASQAATHCSHLTAFVSGPDLQPRMVLAANSGPLPLARALAERYVKQYWHLDPANSLARSGGVPEGGATLRIRPDDIRSAQYRSDCYTGVELADRFSLMQPVCGRLYRLNFYGRSRSPGFDDDSLRDVQESADMLIALLARHERAAAAPPVTTDAALAERLRLLCPAMPRREVEICVGIARGLTSEGISLHCGIAFNTVLTYRKRAYARLGISSQNELMRCVAGYALH